MPEGAIYQNFIDWLGKTWWGLPDSKDSCSGSVLVSY